MRRGEVWTVAGGKDFAGKPRPILILQDDRFGATASVTICPFTTDATVADFVRLPVEATVANGLRAVSRLMVDKVTTVSRDKVGVRIGQLESHAMVRVNQAVLVFLGLATPVRSRQDPSA